MAMNFNIVFDFLGYIDQEGDFLEIGTERGDKSTPMLGMLAKHYNKKLYSIDIDPVVYMDAVAKYSNGPYNVEFINQKGEDFLAATDKKFTLVLLDNFDWIWNPLNIDHFIVAQQENYKNNLNMEMNNINSQSTHLIQAIALEPKLTRRAIIVCDDTMFLPEQGIYSGKCGAAIPYLLSKGFRVEHTAQFGVILVRDV